MTRTPVSRSASPSRPVPAWSPSPPPPASCRSTCRNPCWSASRARCRPGITLRDLVNAIPLYAIKAGLLTVEKKGKNNVFSGRILEIEGLPDLKVEQAFELSDAAAERSAAACSVRLNKAPMVEYMRSNITLMKWMIAEGYQDARTLKRRIAAMEDWIANGVSAPAG